MARPVDRRPAGRAGRCTGSPPAHPEPVEGWAEFQHRGPVLQSRWIPACAGMTSGPGGMAWAEPPPDSRDKVIARTPAPR